MSKSNFPLEKETEIRALAFDYLARQECTQKQLRDKLLRRTEQVELVEKVLKQLVDDGYQSDQRFTEIYVRQKSESGQGAIKIIFDLKRKGVDEQLIKRCLASQESDPKQLALEYLRRKFGLVAARDQKEKAKWMRHMAGRGFGFDEISFALRYQQQDPDEWL